MEFPHATFLSSASGTRAGATPWELHRGYVRGSLVRVRHGVYLPAEQWLSGTGWDRYALTTASLAVRDQSPVFCRETGLLLWGLGLARIPQTVEYLTGRRQMLGRSAAPSLYGNRDALEELKARVAPDLSMLPTGFRDARRLGSSTGKWSVVSRRLGLPLHVQDFDGLLADTLHRLSFPEAVVVTDQVIPAERGSARAGERCTRSKEHLAALCAALGKGAQRERMAAVLAFADPLSESVGESYSRSVISMLGFELPELQFRVLGPSGEVARTDFHWRERKLVGEFDGLMKYTRARELSGKTAAQVVTEEKLREDRIRELGYGVVRWVWDEVMNPERLAAKLLRAGVPRRTRRGR